jgi:phenylacetate-coenzyme A ligase PaaK-like adenylate-forming protein
MGDEILNKLLITHLHSYATPLIRYEVGDYGKLHSTCPCGHDGATLSHIYGRKKFFVKNKMGKLIAFPIFSKPLSDIIHFTEFFIFQDNLESLHVELGGRAKISTEEKSKVVQFIKRLVGEEFNVNVMGVDQIDWSKNPKRLPFIRYVE